MSGVMNVLYQHDNNYAVYGGVSIFSLFVNNKGADEINVYMIDPGLSDEYKRDYAKLARKYGRNIYYIPAQSIIQKVRDLGIPTYRGSYATYLKVFAIDTLPDEIGRIFYMDSDTLVLGDLSPLFGMDMEKNAVGMSYDGFSFAVKDIEGFAGKEPYFCGGTILFDIKAWKEQRCSDRIAEYAANVRSAFFAADQNLLNRVLKGQITKLDLRYDFYYFHCIYSDKTFLREAGDHIYYSAEEMERARKDIGVLHFMRFLGEEPWHARSLHPNKKQFEEYLRRSPWKKYEELPAKTSCVFKIEKMMYVLLPRNVFFKLFIYFFRRNYQAVDKRLREGTQLDVH